MAKHADRVQSKDEIIAEEDLVIDVQFLIQELLDEKGVSRSELSEKVGISKARLSQLLGTDANPTLRNIARILHSLDERLDVGVKSRRKFFKKPEPTSGDAKYTYESPTHQARVESDDRATQTYLAIESSFAKAWIQGTVSIASNDSYPVIEDQEFVLDAA